MCLHLNHLRNFLRSLELPAASSSSGRRPVPQGELFQRSASTTSEKAWDCWRRLG